MPRPAWPPYAELAVLVDHLWGHAAEGHRYSVLPGEESLTQVAMLSHLRRRFPFTLFRGRLPAARSVHVRKFSLGEEGKTGADWNLLMFDPSGGRVSFRIQAKRLFESGRFSKMKATQTERLIALSARQGAIPMFGLYQGPQYAPNVSACWQPGANDRIGCVVRHATSLAAASPTSAAAWQSEAALGLPLQCLAGCYCYGAGTSTPTAKSGDPFNPATHDLLPKPHGASQAQRIVGTAAYQAAPEDDAEMRERLVAATDALANLPDDRLGSYWDEREGDLSDLDGYGRELFEDVSHLVVVDSRPETSTNRPPRPEVPRNMAGTDVRARSLT